MPLARSCGSTADVTEHPLQRRCVREPAGCGSARKFAADCRAGADDLWSLGTHRPREKRSCRSNCNLEDLTQHFPAFQPKGLANEADLCHTGLLMTSYL